jgi:hypothetical protein
VTEEIAVPAQQRLWLDEHQRVPPVGDHRCETNEDEPINGAQLRGFMPAKSRAANGVARTRGDEATMRLQMAA